MNTRTAIQTCTQLPEDNLVIIALHLTFGESTGPYEWGKISETICNLATEILQSTDWDPVSLNAPNQHLVPDKKILVPKIPFGEGKELVIVIPVNLKGF